MLITKDVDNENGIDPFINSLTMPSVCHEVYRKLFMPVDSIALIPAFGFLESRGFILQGFHKAQIHFAYTKYHNLTFT